MSKRTGAKSKGPVRTTDRQNPHTSVSVGPGILPGPTGVADWRGLVFIALG